MGPQQAQASHQSILNSGHWGRSCVKEALEPAISLEAS